ncbi:DUF2484 family protein [Marivivens sp. LCG002]|uniref:DUF2484 family protein n=1 Tax=Marivivens sp. LCG002 TaxID=3051171 RepID=UPI002553EC95|nr:DUF2484 family protein [Marivivens sp. LCG002]WIV51655.1 DUF2484 family protein [Marivivens sp. LCG002]
MSTSILIALVWFVAANIAGLLPSRDNHWRRAYILIATGVPILGYVTFENGPLVGLICFAAGASILRWPIVFLSRWLRAKFQRSRA